MKKFLAMILIIAMALSLLTACKGNTASLGDLIGDALKEAANEAEAANDNGNNGSGGNNNVISGKASSYSQAYEQINAIQNAIGSTLDAINEKHNENLEYGDPEYTGLVSFYFCLFSMDLAFTATLNEDPSAISGVKMAYSFFGLDAEIDHPKANEYIISYKTEEGDSKTEECKFDPSTGSLSFVSKKNGEINYFFEFVNLGGDKYAFQTNAERSVLTYKNGTLLNFAYSTYNINEWSEDKPYDYAKASIYPNGSGTDINWVFADGVESYRTAYNYDGNTLKIDTNSDWGDGTHVVINVK